LPALGPELERPIHKPAFPGVHATVILRGIANDLIPLAQGDKTRHIKGLRCLRDSGNVLRVAIPCAPASRTDAWDQLVDAAATAVHDGSRGSVWTLVLIIQHAISVEIRVGCDFEIAFDKGAKARRGKAVTVAAYTADEGELVENRYSITTVSNIEIRPLVAGRRICVRALDVETPAVLAVPWWNDFDNRTSNPAVDLHVS